MSLQFMFASGVSELDAAVWDALGDGSPFVSHAFLSALENTGCVGADSGWHPCPLLVKDGERIIGAMPLYAKSHSYGEYVFDWAWANAFEQHGIHYYPKLVCAIPFSPVTGPRLLSQDERVRQLMLDTLGERLMVAGWSSAHVLFPDEDSSRSLQSAGWLKREGVQFRWENEGYENFDQFLSTLTHDKRKKIRQERKKLCSAGVSVRRMVGTEITEADWAFFYQCYVNTYYEHRSSPYLNEAFFFELANKMPGNLLLIVAEYEGRRIASALSVIGENRSGVSQVYGRYWGALAFVPGLHFELCYYQAQEFCIETGMRYLEGGAQGEHKLARGLKPRPTSSFHRIADPRFSKAIERALSREAGLMHEYQTELEERMPFRRTSYRKS